MKALLAVALASCAPLHSSAPPSPHVDFGPHLLAGIARAEITPPPGLAIFGHGPEGRVSVGRRHRLYCRAFVLTRGEDAVALLPCDLSEVSLELAREIAVKVAEHAPISADRIVLSATHAHGGPAHFFGSANYSGPLSSRAYGFDEKVLEWIALRAAAAVEAAYQVRTEARLRWEKGDLCHLTQNRSYVPFAQNRIEDVAPSLRCDGAPAEQAVDPSIFALVIETRSRTWEAAGVYAVFGIHGTIVPNTNDLYEGDLFGFAEAMLEHRRGARTGTRCLDLRRKSTACPERIVGIANGIEGDVMPAYHRQGFTEAKRIGVALGSKIDSLAAGTASAASELDHRYRELLLPNARYSGCALCERPTIGVAAGGGAEGGETSLRIFPLVNEGAGVLASGECYSPKIPLYTMLPTTTTELPGIAPLLIARIGNGVLAALPFEPTTVTGLRMRNAIAAEYRSEPAVDAFPIVGLANSYLQYVATREEYQLQHYEGASTLYGPSSAEFFTGHIACLARSLRGDPEPCPGDYPMGQIVKQDYRPSPIVDRIHLDKTCELHDAASVGVHPSSIDAAPGYTFDFRGPRETDSACWQDLAITIVDAEGETIASDVFDDFELRHRRSAEAWSATWLVDQPRPGSLSFRVSWGAAGSIASPSFCVQEPCR